MVLVGDGFACMNVCIYTCIHIHVRIYTCTAAEEGNQFRGLVLADIKISIVKLNSMEDS